jgi:two-component system sensor histidine kinase BaeS
MKTVLHEIRNQLAVAVANIEAFIDGKLEPTPRRLGAVLQALHELDALLDDVGARVPATMPTEPRIVDICSIISNEVLAIEATTAEREITFSVRQCPVTHQGCRAFSGDPLRIGQVVKNLLLNAVKYAPRGGHVVVDCHREPEHFAFSIANDGPGISAEDLPHVFEPGFRARGETSAGSGLGLAVVRRLVESHGGTIQAESRPGEWTTFTVRLPDTSKITCPPAREPGAGDGLISLIES